MFNNLLNKGKCTLGFHKGQWRYELESDCTLLQICELCAKQLRKVEHTWSDWVYPNITECTLERTCKRCHQKEQTVKHVWGQAVYMTDDSCGMAAICTRCQSQNPAGTVHQWGAWVYTNGENCQQNQVCEPCGSVGNETRVAHEWGQPMSSRFYEKTVFACTHCGDMRFGSHELTMESMHKAMIAVITPMQGRYPNLILTTLRQQQKILQDPAFSYCLQFAKEANPQSKDALEVLQGLLQRARQIGFDSAVAEWFPSSQVASPQPKGPPQRSTESAVSQPTSQQPARVSAQRNQNLVGHWRHDYSVGGGEHFMSTSTHIILEKNGTARRYRYTVDTIRGERHTPEEQGTWTDSGGARAQVW